MLRSFIEEIHTSSELRIALHYGESIHTNEGRTLVYITEATSTTKLPGSVRVPPTPLYFAYEEHKTKEAAQTAAQEIVNVHQHVPRPLRC